MIELNNIKYYSKEEVCQLLNVHPKTLNSFISSGKLPVHRPTRNMTYITEGQIQDFIHCCSHPSKALFGKEEIPTGKFPDTRKADH